MRSNIKHIEGALRNLVKSAFCFSGKTVALTLFIFSLCIPQINAQKFEFDHELKTIYEDITQLNLEKAETSISSYKTDNPSNFLVYHVENYIDFFRCFIDEDYEYFKSIRDRKNERLSKIQEGDKTSPYYNFSQAEILLQWALLRLKFEEYTTALLEMNRAISLLEENDKRFPNFIANKKSLSALHALVGTIPESYKSILSWVSSFNGSIEQGYNEIKEVEEKMAIDEFPFASEVLVIKSLIELHILNRSELAYESSQSEHLDPSQNPLLCFIVANIAHNTGKNDEAIHILESYKPTLSQHPLYYLDYLKGIYKLNRLDTDSDRYIRRFLNYFQGRHYIKEAYQKLAWHAWVIEGDSIEYRRNMTFCLLKGEDLIDEDKQALNLACQRLLPNRTLLKVRLLSDGAYLNEALAELEQLDSSDLKLNHAIEYAYRKARILQNLGRLQEAIDSYQHCLSFSYTEDLYYQIASHFYLGQVYELQQDYKSANFHYNQCLKSKSSQYQRSLHQKAKVGLLRLKSK